MGICAQELRIYVIAPCLRHLGEWSPVAENLLMGTAAFESGLGFHLHADQVADTRQQPGLGIFRIQPQQHTDIWDSYLVHDPDMASKVRGLASQREFLNHPHAELATNLSYATAIAWMIYRKTAPILPDAGNIEALAQVWLHSYRNTPDRQQSHGDNALLFIQAYQECIGAIAA